MDPSLVGLGNSIETTRLAILVKGRMRFLPARVVDRSGPNRFNARQQFDMQQEGGSDGLFR
jgi:hypothetical protein